MYMEYGLTILLTKTTARKYSLRTLQYLSTTSLCTAVVFVRCDDTCVITPYLLLI